MVWEILWSNGFLWYKATLYHDEAVLERNPLGEYYAISALGHRVYRQTIISRPHVCPVTSSENCDHTFQTREVVGTENCGWLLNLLGEQIPVGLIWISFSVYSLYTSLRHVITNTCYTIARQKDLWKKSKMLLTFQSSFSQHGAHGLQYIPLCPRSAIKHCEGEKKL